MLLWEMFSEPELLAEQCSSLHSQAGRVLGNVLWYWVLIRTAISQLRLNHH